MHKKGIYQIDISVIGRNVALVKLMTYETTSRRTQAAYLPRIFKTPFSAVLPLLVQTLRKGKMLTRKTKLHTAEIIQGVPFYILTRNVTVFEVNDGEF